MARSHRILLSEVLDNLGNDDFDDLMAEGSDNDLGMAWIQTTVMIQITYYKVLFQKISLNFHKKLILKLQ